jgi:hypothetical protein
MVFSFACYLPYSSDGLDTHIYDLSVSSGRLKLKENDVEDRHLVGGTMEDVVTSILKPNVAIRVFSILQYVYLCGFVSLDAGYCSYVLS